MTSTDIFLLQLSMSMLVYGLLAIWIGRPWLSRLSTTDAIFWLTVPHAFRHIGLVFEVPGIVSPDLPAGFSGAAAYGDLTAAGLAIATLVALKLEWAIKIPLAWTLTIVGMVDLGYALSHMEVIPLLQAAWYIPTFIVPLLLVTHVMTAATLITHLREGTRPVAAE